MIGRHRYDNIAEAIDKNAHNYNIKKTDEVINNLLPLNLIINKVYAERQFAMLYFSKTETTHVVAVSS